MPVDWFVLGVTLALNMVEAPRPPAAVSRPSTGTQKTTPPDLDFLEFIGSWETPKGERDTTWLLDLPAELDSGRAPVAPAQPRLPKEKAP